MRRTRVRVTRATVGGGSPSNRLLRHFVRHPERLEKVRHLYYGKLGIDRGETATALVAALRRDGLIRKVCAEEGC